MAKKKKEEVTTSVPSTPDWPIPDLNEQRKTELIQKIREGMPSVSSMQTQGFGVLRRHTEWAKRAAPYIKELSAIEGRPVSVERYRPGR